MRPSRCRKAKSRRGAAVVEFACALLPLFLIVFGSIEACNAIFLQQFITNVGYQGALAATRYEATEANLEANMQALLTARGISGASVALTGTLGEDYGSLASGEKFKISIQVPSSAMGPGPSIAQYIQLQTESYGRKP